MKSIVKKLLFLFILSGMLGTEVCASAVGAGDSSAAWASFPEGYKSKSYGEQEAMLHAYFKDFFDGTTKDYKPVFRSITGNGQQQDILFCQTNDASSYYKNPKNVEFIRDLDMPRFSEWDAKSGEKKGEILERLKSLRLSELENIYRKVRDLEGAGRLAPYAAQLPKPTVDSLIGGTHFGPGLVADPDTLTIPTAQKEAVTCFQYYLLPTKTDWSDYTYTSQNKAPEKFNEELQKRWAQGIKKVFSQSARAMLLDFTGGRERQYEYRSKALVELEALKDYEGDDLFDKCAAIIEKYKGASDSTNEDVKKRQKEAEERAQQAAAQQKALREQAAEAARLAAAAQKEAAQAAALAERQRLAAAQQKEQVEREAAEEEAARKTAETATAAQEKSDREVAQAADAAQREQEAQRMLEEAANKSVEADPENSEIQNAGQTAEKPVVDNKAPSVLSSGSSNHTLTATIVATATLLGINVITERVSWNKLVASGQTTLTFWQYLKNRFPQMRLSSQEKRNLIKWTALAVAVGGGVAHCAQKA